MQEPKYVGTVIWFDNRAGYGFIAWENNGQQQKDMFVHFSNIECAGFKTLKKDQKVQFSIGTNNKGAPKATDVRCVDE